jgi:glutamate-ammonia-ligase adenylyltransferase
LHQPSLLEGLPENELSGPDPLWADRAWSIVHREWGYEQRLEWIRRLKNERMLEIVINDLRGWFGPAEAEEKLTALADWTIQATWEAVINHCAPDLKLPIAILGLGKLGSREMGYLSDVDLMFVCALEEDTDRIPGRVVRLIQRFMRMVSTPLQEGPGYVVDAQIRPSGTYGPLVVSVSRWMDYYRREADIWEVQALLRMRAVAGSSSLGQRLEKEAGKICAKSRAREAVWPRLCQLRRRMEMERSRETRSTLDLKLGSGGLADVEFLVQGAQLTQGQEQMRGLGVMAVIDMFGPEIGLSTLDLHALRKWYIALRSLELRLQLLTNQASSLISRDIFIRLQKSGLWPPGDAAASIREWIDIQVGRREIRKMWDQMCV